MPVSKIFTTQGGEYKILIKETTDEDSIEHQFNAKCSFKDGTESEFFKESYHFPRLMEELKDGNKWINNEDEIEIRKWANMDVS